MALLKLVAGATGMDYAPASAIATLSTALCLVCTVYLALTTFRRARHGVDSRALSRAWRFAILFSSFGVSMALLFWALGIAGTTEWPIIYSPLWSPALIWTVAAIATRIRIARRA